MRLVVCLTVAVCCGLTVGPAGAAAPGVPAIGGTPGDFVTYAETDLPDHFRNAPPAVTAPADWDNTPGNNPITNWGAELGRILFYDTRLSHDASTSCASCHQQSAGFADPAPTSTGVDGQTDRKSMGLSNGRFYASGKFFWDERSPTLEHQVLQPIQSPVEMGETLSGVEQKLAATDFYPTLFEAAFGDSQITSERMSLAMAQFVRSMVSYQSKFDEAFDGPGPPDFAGSFTASELRGQQHFAANCAECHATTAQVGDQAHNIGLDLVSDASQGTDEGAGDGLFKTPSLRNVAVRDTYMHDGRFESLEEVVEFYSTGVRANPNLSSVLQTGGGLPRRLNFSDQAIEDLVAFMNTLTDDTFLTMQLFSDPFVTLDGDYDGNGRVEAADLEVWLAGYGALGDHNADGNGDQLVDARDYAVWRENLGASWQSLGLPATPGVAVGSPAPEPTGAVLLMLTLMGGLRGRGGRRG